MKAVIKTSSDLIRAFERAHPESYFFTKETMSFFGDTRSNYYLSATRQLVESWGSDDPIECYALQRKKPTSKGQTSATFFAVDDLRIVSSK